MNKKIIIFFICMILLFIVLCMFFINGNKTKDSFKNIGEEANEYYKGIENAQSHLNEFEFNYENNEVEYKPIITLNLFNKVNENMTEEEIIKILGNYDFKAEGENTYLLSWGQPNMSKGYWIQIILSKENKMISKSQIGLK